jgi:hypothetical protein
MYTHYFLIRQALFHACPKNYGWHLLSDPQDSLYTFRRLPRSPAFLTVIVREPVNAYSNGSGWLRYVSFLYP